MSAFTDELVGATDGGNPEEQEENDVFFPKVTVAKYQRKND